MTLSSEHQTPMKEPGLYLGNKDYIYLNAGVYSVVFVSKDNKTVIKLFRADVPRGKAEYVFNSEVDAAKKAGASTKLSPHVPAFHGVRKIEKVYQLCTQQTFEKNFHTDLAFEMDYIPGDYTKIGISGQLGTAIKQLFQMEGVPYLADACVFGDINNYKVIDYGMLNPDDYKT